MSFTLVTLEQTSYLDALMFQENFFNAQLNKKANGEQTSNTLILLEHNPVYTLGKSGKKENLLTPIENIDAEFHQTDRGGDITFHGPGQLVGYPIFDLDSFSIRTKEFVSTLEQIIIDCLAEYQLTGTTIESAPGIYIVEENKKPRKICALGLKVSRNVTMHGFAFNVNTNLDYFKNIIPCGLQDKDVTSLSAELGRKIDMQEFQAKLISHMEQHFGKIA